MPLVINDPHLSPPSKEMTTRDLSAIKLFIVHHSASYKTITCEQIDAEHRAQGWCMAGYHFFIDGNAKLWKLRPLDAVPAAAEGANTDSVDVCLAGDFEPSSIGFTGGPSQEQLDALVALRVYCQKEVPSIEKTIGHRDVQTMIDAGDPLVTDPGENVSTACPGQILYDWLPQLKQAAQAAFEKSAAG